MNKKMFFILSPSNIIFYIILLSIVILSKIGTIVFLISDYYPSEAIIVFLGSGIFIGYALFALISQRIIFEENYMYASKSKKIVAVIQYETIVYYKEIIDIFLVADRLNSLKKIVQNDSWGPGLYNYMALSTIDGNQYRICFFNRTRRQKIKIIDELKLRIKNSGNETNFRDTKEIINDIKHVKSKK